MAANKIYLAPEATVTFRDSSGDVVITLINLAAGAGRVSARYDRGAGSKPAEHEVRCVFQMETAGVIGETIEVYLFQSDGTYADGVPGTGDAALTSDKCRNGSIIGMVVIDTTSTATDIIRSFPCIITSRYYSIGVFNRSADNLENTANASRIIVTPVPPEIQAAA